MWQQIKGVLLELAGSKKALVLMATLLALGTTKVLALVHVTGAVTSDDVLPYLTPVVAYLIGQGIADHGKPAS